MYSLHLVVIIHICEHVNRYNAFYLSCISIKMLKGNVFFSLCPKMWEWLDRELTWVSKHYFLQGIPIRKLLISCNAVFWLLYHSVKCSEIFKGIYNSNNLCLIWVIFDILTLLYIFTFYIVHFDILTLSVMYSECYSIISGWYSTKSQSFPLPESLWPIYLYCVQLHSFWYPLGVMLMRDEIIKIRKRAIKLKPRAWEVPIVVMFFLNNQWLTLVRAVVIHCNTKIAEAAYIQYQTSEFFEISFAMIKPVLLSIIFSLFLY